MDIKSTYTEYYLCTSKFKLPITAMLTDHVFRDYVWEIFYDMLRGDIKVVKFQIRKKFYPLS